MHEILAKHSSKAGESPKEKSDAKPPQEPERSIAQLVWAKPEPGAQAVKTLCGHFSCYKVSVNGKTSYELWRLAGGGGWFTRIAGDIPNFKAAQALAEHICKVKP